MKIRSLSLLFFICLSFQTLFAAELEKPNQTNQAEIINRQSVDQTLQRKIMFARKLITEKKYDGASSFLETIYETEPNNPVVLNLLKQCYTQLKLYFKLEELLKKLIELNQSNTGYILSLAETYALQGKTDQALEQYRTSESLIEGVNRVRFQLLIQSMLTHNLMSEAEQYILKWREESGDNTLLGSQMGLIYERKNEYKNALAEYYPLLADTSRMGNNVEKEIVELLLFEDSAPITEEYLLQQNEIEHSMRAVKIL